MKEPWGTPTDSSKAAYSSFQQSDHCYQLHRNFNQTDSELASMNFTTYFQCVAVRTSSSLSKRPGRRRAGSRAWGRFVAPSTNSWPEWPSWKDRKERQVLTLSPVLSPGCFKYSSLVAQGEVISLTMSQSNGFPFVYEASWSWVVGLLC